MNRVALATLRILVATITILSLFPLNGCSGSSASTSTGGTGGSGSPTPLTVGGATNIYGTLNGTGGQILQFPANASGSVSPSSILNLPAGFAVTCVSLDSTGQIYVGGSLINSGTTGEILVYPAGSTGLATPIRTIIGGPTTFYAPERLVVDSSGLLYVVSGTGGATGFDVYSATATGVATPLRIVSGTLTQIEPAPYSIAVDRSGTVYLGNFGLTSGAGSVLAFSSAANGNVAPTRVISGPATQLGTVFSLDTDSSGNIYVVSQAAGLPITAAILEFAANASGNVAPIRVIAGSNTGLGSARGLRVDAAGNIYVVEITGPFYAAIPYVEAFASTVSGNVAPAETFTSAAWTPTSQYELAVK